MKKAFSCVSEHYRHFYTQQLCLHKCSLIYPYFGTNMALPILCRIQLVSKCWLCCNISLVATLSSTCAIYISLGSLQSCWADWGCCSVRTLLVTALPQPLTSVSLTHVYISQMWGRKVGQEPCLSLHTPHDHSLIYSHLPQPLIDGSHLINATAVQGLLTCQISTSPPQTVAQQ